MKPPPTDPEFQRLTDAMRHIMRVSKADIQDELKTTKRKPKASASSASRVRAASTKSVN
jgi:hypothetical protein